MEVNDHKPFATLAEQNQPPVRVCMLANLYHPVVSGSATQVKGMSRALVALGHHVVVITAHVSPDTPEHETIDGVEIYRVPAIRLPKMKISLNFPWLNWVLWPRNVRRMQEILESHRINILHAHNHMFDMAFAAVLLKRRMKIPLFLTMHTVIKHANPFYNSILYITDRFFLGTTVVANVDQIVCPDNSVTAYVYERFKRRDTALVCYGVDPIEAVASGEIDALRDQYGLTGKKVIVSIGHVHAIRNRHELIKALPMVLKRVPNVMLVVVGGVFDKSPAQLAKELGIADRVIFVGAQPRSAIASFLALADVEAHWLNQDDGSWASPGVASMEAMYAGLPVFAVAPEGVYGDGVLKDGENIILVRRNRIDDLAEKLIAVLSDAEKARRIGAAAETMCKTYFNWPRIAEQTASHYSRLLLAMKS